MNGLSEDASKIFESVSKLDCIYGYYLVGGTALALQLNHRLSEDLDFQKWSNSQSGKKGVDIGKVKKDFSTIGNIEEFKILSSDQIYFYVNGVKISFFHTPLRKPTVLKADVTLNNLSVSDKLSIGVMKVELLRNRYIFRDYYDIYSLTKAGIPLKDMISGGLNYANHGIHTDWVKKTLSTPEHFIKEKDFDHLNPIYNVSNIEIGEFIKTAIDWKIRSN